MNHHFIQNQRAEENPRTAAVRNFAERVEGYEFVCLLTHDTDARERFTSEVLRLLPEETVYVRTRIGDFIDEMVEAVMKAEQKNFRKKYSEADVLLLEDFERVTQKEATQTELCRILGERIEAKKPVLLTGKPPESGCMEELEALLKRAAAV
ncbi:MAG: hypothetical protein IJC71_05115 [Clostridia bacterium]|nr:hypothetical protein [Clostridia bacterium]